MMNVDLPDTKYPRIVIIGGGFGGIELAKRLKHSNYQIVMIDIHNYHTFQPLLYQVAMGGLEAESIAFPIRKIFKNQSNFFFRVACALEVFPDRNVLKTDIGEIEYDYLVIATGSVSNYFGQQQIEDNAIPMKSIPEALNLRSLVLESFEKALIAKTQEEKDELLTFVVVGGGPTGVETAGSLAELKNHVAVADYPELNINDVKIYLIEGSPKVLGNMSEKSASQAREALEKLGVQVLTDTRVASYDGDILTTADGQAYRSRAVIWSAGVKGATIKGIPEGSVFKGNRYKCDVHNKIEGERNIFAIGDVSAIITEETPNGHPGVAPTAIQQADNLAKNFKAMLAGDALQPFVYHDKGSMATIGRNKAVVDLGKTHFKGFFAWLTWMFVHLMTLVGFRNKAVVFVNWVWSYFSYDRGTRLILQPFKKKEVTKL